MAKVGKKRRGASMARGNKQARKNRQLGKKWLTVPKGVTFFKEEPGIYKMDILPYVVNDPKKHPEGEYIQEDLWFRYPYRLHRNVGPNKEAIVCPAIIGKPCPICDKRQEIFDDPELDNKLAGKFGSSARSLFVLKMISGAQKDNKDKIMLWDISDFCFYDQVCTELDNGEEDWENFMMLEGGYSLKVRMLEEAFDKNKYSKCDRVDFLPREDYDESILDELPCLDDCILPNIKTFKEIQELMDGIESESREENVQEDDEEEEMKELPKTKKKSLKKKTAPEPEPEEEPEEEEPEEEEEDPMEIPDWDTLHEMDLATMLQLAEDQGVDLGVDPDEVDDEDELREFLIEELGIEKPVTKKKKKLGNKKKETPAKKKATGKKKPEKGTKNAMQCPFAYQFGLEFGDYDECNEKDCEKHDDCFDAYDEAQQE